MSRTAAITGAYGYLGSVLRSAFDARGWTTLALVRSPRAEDSRAVSFHLGERVDPSALAGVDALVHCAYDLRLTRAADIRRVNIEGTGLLLKAAAEAGVRRTIVISSIAAYTGTAQIYGRAKLAIERQAERYGAVVVRPGLVYGAGGGGMVAALAKVVRLPFVPLMAGRSHQFMVHAHDLAAAVLTLSEADSSPPGPVTVAHARAVPFPEVLRTIAAAEGRTPRLVPVPWPAVYGLLRAVEAAGLRAPFKADSLWGLAHPPADAPDAGLGPAPATRPFSVEALRSTS